jgi:Flp pilus assembly protein TadD
LRRHRRRSLLAGLLLAASLRGGPAPAGQPPATPQPATPQPPPPPPGTAAPAPQAASAAPEPAPAASPFAAPAAPFAGRPFLQARRLPGVAVAVAAQVFAAPPGGDLALAALALPAAGGVPPGEERASVLVVVEIDGATFLDRNQSGVARVELYAYAVAADRSVAADLVEVFAVDVGALGESIWQSGLKFFGHLELPAGEFNLRVLVRNAGSGAWGLTAVPLRVPARPAPFLVIPDPAARDAWLPVRASQDPGAALSAAGEPVVPGARPVLVAGRQAVALLFGLGPEQPPPPWRLEFLSVAAAGEPAVAASAEVAAAGGDAAAPGGRPIRFQVPELPTGPYLLRLVPAAAGGDALPALAVEVAAAGPQERSLLWTDLRWLVSPLAAAAADLPSAPAAPPGRRRLPRGARGRAARQLAAEYRRVLGDLAAAGPAAAAVRTALLDLETATLARPGAEPLATLDAAEMAVARELAAANVESLVPVMALHDGLCSAYRSRRLYALSSHTLLLVERLAELYATGGGAAALASRALASVGGLLQEADLANGSRRLFARALELDAANQAALLGLAASFERYGQYARAVEVLERSVASHPEDAEGWMRLAVNLQRTGRRGRAREVLAKLASGPGPEWVQALAQEEVARSLLTTGQVEEAAAGLAGAVSARPDEGGLRFLLAYAYDRLGRRRDALEQLRAVAPVGPRAAAAGSPRRAYDLWPESALAAARRDLAAAAAERLALLAGEGR